MWVLGTKPGYYARVGGVFTAEPFVHSPEGFCLLFAVCLFVFGVGSVD